MGQFFYVKGLPHGYWKENTKMAQIITTPMITLRGKYIFPGSAIHFDVERERSINAINAAMDVDQLIFITNQIDITADIPAADDLYTVGVIAKIKQIMKLPNGIIRALVEGLYRVELTEVLQEDPYYIVNTAVYQAQEDMILLEEEQEAMIRLIKDSIASYNQENPKINRAVVKQLMRISDLEKLIDEIAMHFPLHINQKQILLEEISLKDRAEKLLVMLSEEIDVFRIRKELQFKIKEKIDRNQKEYLLREQLKVIREELGEGISNETDELLDRAKKLRAPKEVKEKLIKEIERYRNTGGASAESYVSRNYIDIILEMPWSKMSKDSKDINRAKEILEEDHYGLTKVKERILEFLAVRTLNSKGDAPIICLVGPPGTGKTSIAKSIARAVNKKYTRISLGGVRDEAEIRGHRKTYIGAMPGRIAEAIRQTGVKNPLMLLDEVDKVSNDYKGSTASALLEVLDGEQNSTFRDHYLEVPLDLSDVLFIATANDITGIPDPLRDRMEIIEISSYTLVEKFHIAKQYLVNKQKDKNGIASEKLLFTDQAIEKIILSYTKEAGVRGLERKIGQVCRKAARHILENNTLPIEVTDKNLDDFLGVELVRNEEEDLTPKIGITRGLAWTKVGGTTLNIEVNAIPGKGRLELTGQLGDVMKESAKIAISYIRSISKKHNISPQYFDKHDIHIHIPEGAVPKDGPSAGITLSTAIFSAVTNQPVRGNLAMTGEVTLRGNVLPIGGLNEKILAAKIIGIEEVLVPEQNKRHVADIDKEITSDIIITYVSSMDEVLEYAMIKED